MKKIAKRKFDRGNGIVVATIVLCFMLTLGLCYFFAGEGILTSAFADGEERAFYAVCQGGYTDVALARSSAELIKLRGGAGYVIKGETCEIILAVYPDKEAAESVMHKSGDKGLYVKEFVASAPKLKWAEKEDKDIISNALNYFDLAFDKLYGLSNSLADGSMTVEDVKTQIKVLYAQINDIKSDFYSKTADNTQSKITDVKLALVTCLALLDNVNTNSTLSAALSSLRYQTVQLVTCYCALAL